MDTDRLPPLNSLEAFEAPARHECLRIGGRGRAQPEGGPGSGRDEVTA